MNYRFLFWYKIQVSKGIPIYFYKASNQQSVLLGENLLCVTDYAWRPLSCDDEKCSLLVISTIFNYEQSTAFLTVVELYKQGSDMSVKGKQYIQ